MSRVICYKCNQANTGVLSQTLEQGITTCPEGWSTSIPNCDPKITVGAPEGGCDAFFEQSCSSTGQVEVEITILSSLLNVQVQNASTNTQLSTCSSAQSPFTVTANNGDLIRVTGYCQDPTLEETWDGGVSVPKPTWAEDNCGNTAVSSTTKIVFFYDTTSLGSGARLNMYNAANDWLLDIQATDGYTGEVYHIEMGGERWVLWPAWLLDLTIDVDGINNPTNASACGANTPSSNWDANEAILAEWNSDSSSYVQATGSQGATKAMPAQIAAGEDVLVVIFADEAVGQPCGYSNTNTGAASGGLGGYHNVAADDQNNTIVTSAHAYYDVALPACITGTPKTLWHHDYDTATPKIAAHNAGSGNIRTYIYPSQPTGTVPGTQRRSFALHVWMAVNSGDANGLLNSGTTPPSCQIADLQNAVSTGSNSNPYYLGGFGQLDTFGFGANVECKAFTMHDFKADLDAFLSLNQNTCDGTDCAAVLVIKPDGTPVSNEQITIGSTTVSTDASGYTALVSGLSGAVLINGCYNYTFSGNCTQYLFKIVTFEKEFTVSKECILGCTDPTAMNYNPNANVDDGSCEYCEWGCTDPLALNYDPLATCDDGSCQLIPPIIECVLIAMAKEILKECHTECGEPEKLTELENDFRELEAILAQVYMLIDCGKIEELRALFPMITRLMNKYQCDSCFNYTGTDGDSTQTQSETSATLCGADISGPCTNILLSPKPDALEIMTKLTGGSWNFQSPTADTIIGDIRGKSLDVTTYCGPINIDKNLLACGMETIPNDTNIYCFYDVTSTCKEDIVEIVNAVELWYQSKVINDPSYTGDVYHIPVHGEKWLACGEYPIDQQFKNGTTSLVNSASNDLLGGNSGYSTTLTVNVLDRSTIGTTNTIVTQQMYGPKAGSAAFNDIVTGTGALPYLRPGASYSDRGLAGGGQSDTKAVVLCFFDEAEGPQGGGAYHDRSPDGSNYEQPPYGVIGDFGGAPHQKWKTDYNSFVAKHPSYDFFKGFLYPVIPGIHTGSAGCGVPTTVGNPHNGKMSFILCSLAGIHSGVWNVSTDGPVPVNPVISAEVNVTQTAAQGTNIYGNLNALTLANNPYVVQGFDGLDQYGWSMDPTVGLPGTNSIAGVFTGGQFGNTLNSLLSGGASCNGTDCLTVIIKDAVTGAVIPADTYTQTAVTVSPGIHQLLDPSSNVTIETVGECSEYIVTLFREDMDTYSDCIITTQITCGCGGNPEIIISVGEDIQIVGDCDSGETSYGTITNETTGVTNDIIYDPDNPGPLTGSITLDTTLKNSSFFQPNTEIPDGRYKIVLYLVGGETVELCFLILCDSYAKLLDAFERYTLAIECCPKCTAPYDAYEKCYTLYRVLKVTGIDCGLEPWIDKAIANLQKLCSACAASAECDETC